MKWESFMLDEKTRNSIHIPPGCANAFLTMEPNCVIHYYCSQYYEPSAERGVRYDDPAFKFEWPHKPDVISDKDLSHPNYFSV
jgi:dTDP-4-dehydrorhamnose 3,5-epimerase